MDTLKTGTRRRHFTSRGRQRLLAKFHQSQLTQNEFAAQYNIGLSSLSRWLRLERKAVPPKVKFQEVRLSNSVSKWPVEVVSPQGWVVRLQHDLDVHSLPELLRALPC